MGRVDLTGQTFGRLTVIERAESDNRHNHKWLCRCTCGETRSVIGYNLTSGLTKSCGCLHREMSTGLGHWRRTHGKRHTPTYRTWLDMIQRCTNPNNPRYTDYGGRGITVCERWRSFENFYADMGDRPGAGYSLDRIDNDSGYAPGNCRWATAEVQQRNKRRSLSFTLADVPEREF